MTFHVRYSVKTSSMFANNGDPIQHAVDNESIKTLCGRNASELWKLGDEFDGDEKQITCNRCRITIAKANNND